MDIDRLIEELTRFLDGRTQSGFTIERVKIGRTSVHNAHVHDRVGAINFIDVLTTLLDRSMRRRAGNYAMFPAGLPGAAPAKLLSQEMKQYLELCSQRHLSPSYIRNIRFCARILLTVCDDIPVSQITHEHIVEFWDSSRWWPTEMLRQRKLRGLTDKQILAAGKAASVPPPADTTVQKRLKILSTFFEHLIEKRAICYSPCDALQRSLKKSNHVSVRRQFTDDELKAMFDPEAFVRWATLPHLWWMPMIGLYSGARVTEIAQLKINDIERIDGTWCFHIRVTVDEDRVDLSGFRSRQQLKGETSTRIIPIAQPLLDAGFLDFVDDIQQLPHARLFPHLSHPIDPATGNPDGTGYSTVFRRRFTPYVRRFVPDKQVSFHAFRHTFCNALNKLDEPLPLIAKLTGHRPGREVPTLENFYIEDDGGRSKLKAMAAVINRLTPPVSLVRYRKGQFSKSLRDRRKLHP